MLAQIVVFHHIVRSLASYDANEILWFCFRFVSTQSEQTIILNEMEGIEFELVDWVVWICARSAFGLGCRLLVAQGVCEWLTQSKQTLSLNEMEGLLNLNLWIILKLITYSWTQLPHGVSWRNWDFEGSKNMHAPSALRIIQLWWGANTCSYALYAGSFIEIPFSRLFVATTKNSPL